MPGPAARSYIGGSVIEQPKAIIGTDDSRLPPRMPLPDVAIESGLPASLPPERPTAVFLEGRAPGVRHLELLVDGVAHRPAAQRMPRVDLGERCGWWGIVPLPGRAAGEEIVLAARADGGETELARISVQERGQSPFLHEGGHPSPNVKERGLSPIAVCMATYEPDPELFRRQVESIRAQTDTDWVCVISDDASGPEALAGMREVLGDDERFLLSPAAERQGFFQELRRGPGPPPPGAAPAGPAHPGDARDPP